MSGAQVDGVFQAVLAGANSPGVERNHNGCWVKEFPQFPNSNSTCGRKRDFFKFFSMCSLPFLALLCRFWFARHRYWSPDTHALESTTWQWVLHAREQSPEAPLPGERPRAVRCSTPEGVPGRYLAFPDTTLRSQPVGWADQTALSSPREPPSGGNGNGRPMTHRSALQRQVCMALALSRVAAVMTARADPLWSPRGSP
jgi:hypothetical protein